jgi:cystathionine gamma-synthase
LGVCLITIRFPYIDTLKLQEKFTPGCHFYGRGDSNDLAALRTLLLTERISCLVCEFPSNPLLKSPPLHILWDLANEYNFILIVDETVGNPINISCLAYCHIIVSSLTKIFSGDSNVMAGSICVNPNSTIYHFIKNWLKVNYHNDVWCEDIIFLERNSRTFSSRILQINRTAEALCDAIRTHPKGNYCF